MEVVSGSPKGSLTDHYGEVWLFEVEKKSIVYGRDLSKLCIFCRNPCIAPLWLSTSSISGDWDCVLTGTSRQWTATYLLHMRPDFLWQPTYIQRFSGFRTLCLSWIQESSLPCLESQQFVQSTNLLSLCVTFLWKFTMDWDMDLGPCTGTFDSWKDCRLEIKHCEYILCDRYSKSIGKNIITFLGSCERQVWVKNQEYIEMEEVQVTEIVYINMLSSGGNSGWRSFRQISTGLSAKQFFSPNVGQILLQYKVC